MRITGVSAAVAMSIDVIDGGACWPQSGAMHR
jgi:hypothetical protein